MGASLDSFLQGQSAHRRQQARPSVPGHKVFICIAGTIDARGSCPISLSQHVTHALWYWVEQLHDAISRLCKRVHTFKKSPP